MQVEWHKEIIQSGFLSRSDRSIVVNSIYCGSNAVTQAVRGFEDALTTIAHRNDLGRRVVGTNHRIKHPSWTPSIQIKLTTQAQQYQEKSSDATQASCSKRSRILTRIQKLKSPSGSCRFYINSPFVPRTSPVKSQCHSQANRWFRSCPAALESGIRQRSLTSAHLRPRSSS